MRERITPSESIELPRNPDIERLTLGALLLSESPERVLEVRSQLPADAFMGQMRDVYLALCDMAEQRDSNNPVVLMTRLAERGSKVEPATIAMLTDGAPIRSDLTTERSNDGAGGRRVERPAQRAHG
jgi:replicative DNA helicase